MIPFVWTRVSLMTFTSPVALSMIPNTMVLREEPPKNPTRDCALITAPKNRPGCEDALKTVVKVRLVPSTVIALNTMSDCVVVEPGNNT